MGIEPDFNKKLRALEVSHDIRKFEIELMWKRSTFVWTIVTVTIVGVSGLVFSDTEQQKLWITIPASLFGLLLTISWYYMNRGSKYWQEKWEDLIVEHENDVTGPLYSRSSTTTRKYDFMSLNEGYPFSPSRILVNISIFFVLAWYAIITYQAYAMFAYIRLPMLRFAISLLISADVVVPLMAIVLVISKRKREDESVT